MFTYNQVDIFYERSETGSRPVLLLHGWGLSGKAMGTLGRFLSARDMRVIAPDLPGFGKSFVPPESADIYFYADAVEQLMRSENCVGCDVVAHSFGARIALILAARGMIGRMIIVDGAGIKPVRTLKQRFAEWNYKLRKKLSLPTDKCGSEDYRALSDHMKKVFVRIVNQDLAYLLPEIRCETLILWGKNDRETPLYMAKRLKEGIAGSEIVLLEGGHFAYLEDSFAFLRVTEAFLCR
jgi:hydrolase, alpha/beta domain protein